MIYHILEFFHERGTLAINPFQYITVRAAAALITALLTAIWFGPKVLAALRQLKAGQPIRTVSIKGAPDLAEMHGRKAGTPTMGGVLIVGALILAVMLFCNLLNPLVWLLILVTFGFGALGFLDDYLKITKKNADGLSPKKKVLGQVILGFFVGAYLYFFGMWGVLPVEYEWFEGGIRHGPFDGYGYIMVPCLKMLYLGIGAVYIPYAVVVLIGSSNAVNLTDGLDGLCIGIMTIVALTFMVVCYTASNVKLATYLMLPYVPKADEMVVFMGALTGACLGFLWFNAYPADMFMGDTGSLSLGGIIGTVALVCKQELLLAIVGGIFVLEALSVLIQVTSFRLFKRRVFLMAPIHHHYERKGIPEAKIIARFWIITAMLALIGLSTLKLR